MKLIQALAIALWALGCSDEPSAKAPSAPSGEHLEISRAGARPSVKGAAENFSGSVVVTPLFQATAHARASGASVAFEPGARSAWHSHPAGQTLIVTSGNGWVQEWGGTKQELHPGDVVWTPPGVKHWHGATLSSAMTHTAIQEQLNGKVVDWLEPVSDEQYGSAAQAVIPAPHPAAASEPPAASGAEQGTAKVVRVAELEIDPVQLDAYLALVKDEMEESIRVEPGVLAIHAAAHKDDPTKITFFEMYADEAAYLSHRDAPHFKRYVESTKDMIKARKLMEMTPVQLSAKTR
jgi:quercetin dioxygenase-like cupin family protein/quinol monooxygenase YgiN